MRLYFFASNLRAPTVQPFLLTKSTIHDLETDFEKSKVLFHAIVAQIISDILLVISVPFVCTYWTTSVGDEPMKCLNVKIAWSQRNIGQ